MKIHSATTSLFTLAATLLGAASASAQYATPSVAPVYAYTGEHVALTVCDRGSDESTWCTKMAIKSSWSGSDNPYNNWIDMDDGTYNGPAIVTEGVEPIAGTSQDIYVRGWDNYLWRKTISTFDLNAGYQEYSWSRLDATRTMSESPAALRMLWNGDDPMSGTYDYFLFVRNSDNSVSCARPWSYPIAWTDLGGTILYGPAAASRNVDQMDLFVVGTDNAVWSRSYNGGWGNWYSLGGYINATPGAVSEDSGHVGVYVRGGDNMLWANDWFAGYSWQGWYPLGPDFEMTSGPAVIANLATRTTYVFARGTDGAIWYYSTQGDGQWHQMPGKTFT